MICLGIWLIEPFLLLCVPFINFFLMIFVNLSISIKMKTLLLLNLNTSFTTPNFNIYCFACNRECVKKLENR